MAIILAEPTAPSGSHWSSPASWVGGIVPGPGDIAVANTRDISIWQDAACAEIRNDTTGSATAGGRFRLRPNATLAANVYAGNVSPTGAACLFYDGAGPATLIGNSVAGSVASSWAIRCAGASSILNIYGNVTGGSVAGAYGLVHGFGTVNLYGDAIGSSAAAGYYGGGSTLQNAVTFNLFGNAYPGPNNSGHGVYIYNYYNLKAVGNIFASANTGISAGLYMAGFGSAKIYGTLYGGGYGPGSSGLSLSYAAVNASTGTLQVYRTEMGSRGMPAISGPFSYINPRAAQQIVRATGALTAVTLKGVLGWTPDPSDALAGTIYEGRTGVWIPKNGQIIRMDQLG